MPCVLDMMLRCPNVAGPNASLRAFGVSGELGSLGTLCCVHIYVEQSAI